MVCMVVRTFSMFAGPALAAGLLAGCGQNEAPDDAAAQAPAIERVKTAAQALVGANIPTLDPATMNDAEIRKVIGDRPRCTFRYTSSGKPVLVAGLGPGGSPEIGVAKLNGNLVSVAPDDAATGFGSGGFVLVADPVRLRVRPISQAAASAAPGGSRVEADMMFEVGQALKVGYGGYLECTREPPAHAALR